MEVVVLLFYFLFLILIPAALLFISAKVYGDGIKLPVIIVKLILTFAVYLIASVFTIFFVLFFLIGPDPRPGSHGTGVAAQTIGLLAVFIYGFVGWLLCSFVNGRIIKTYKTFNLHSEKPQSIFSGR